MNTTRLHIALYWFLINRTINDYCYMNTLIACEQGDHLFDDFFCLVRLFPLHRWRFSEKQDSGDLVAKWHGCFMKTILLPLIFVCSVELDWQKLWYTQCYFVMLNVVWRSIETERYINVKCWIYRCGSSGECHLIINTVSSVCRAHPLDPPQTHSSCFNSFPFFLKKKYATVPQRLTLSMLFELKQHAYKELKKIQRFYLFSIFAVYQLNFLKDIALRSYGMTKHMLSMFCGGKRKITLEEAIVSIQQNFFNELFVIV